MHIQIIKNDHAPYEAMVKVRETASGEPVATWYIQSGIDGYYAQSGNSIDLGPSCDTVAMAIATICQDVAEEMFGG
jgi:hypothetical protein